MRRFSRARSTPLARLCAFALLGSLLACQGMAAESGTSHPPEEAAERAQPVQPATPPQVTWPDNGIAQRRLEGGFNYNMFVENDNGTWRAWVQSDMGGTTAKTRAKAKALDFFTGNQQMVKASVDEVRLQQDAGFMDSRENIHGPRDRRFEFNQGGGVAGLKRGVLSFDANLCSDTYFSLQGGTTHAGVFHPTWTKIPLIYDKTYAGKGGVCDNGTYNSLVNSTLDLNDGTFLVTMRCWVFRLRKSDLSPVGEAPALRVIDEAAIKSAIENG